VVLVDKTREATDARSLVGSVHKTRSSMALRKYMAPEGHPAGSAKRQRTWRMKLKFVKRRLSRY
jgi:hypothetical protein